ncbi:DgyrCDS6583 [Dimorphilus gyrociliatus]|uniref:DgyrCDS6583 n=1 Tax=Dimorphilus gyrociliatus TaxID=2664684 RepID=A0A7I8VQ23_9ANNE|nr:DgyrCDS6583 [Dimorphilus gyrociliatus]
MVRGLVGAKVQTFPVDKLLPKTVFQPEKESESIRHVLLYITPVQKKKKKRHRVKYPVRVNENRIGGMKKLAALNWAEQFLRIELVIVDAKSAS